MAHTAEEITCYDNVLERVDELSTQEVADMESHMIIEKSPKRQFIRALQWLKNHFSQ